MKKKSSKNKPPLKLVSPKKSGKLPLTKNMLERNTRRLTSQITSVNLKVKVLDKKMDARFSIVDSRFFAIDARFSSVDARFNEMDSQLESMNEKIERIEMKCL